MVSINGEGKIGKLVAAFLQAKEAAADANARLDAAKDELSKAMGDIEEKVVSGFKISYKQRNAFDEAAFKQAHRSIWERYLKAPALDVTKFRKENAVLADEFSKPSGAKVLSVGVV